jgi:hypothetical protein
VKIIIDTSGGILGRGLGPAVEISLERLNPALREKALAFLARSPQESGPVTAPARPGPGADRVTYEFRIIDEKQPKSFAVPEDQLSTEDLDLIDDLCHSAESSEAENE